MAHWQHFKLLLWKNFTIQKRHRLGALLQLVVPLLFVIILVLVRQKADTITYSQPEKDPAFLLENCQLDYPTIEYLNSFNRLARITYAPMNDVVDDIMTQLKNRTKINIELVGFGTEADLVKFTTLESNKSMDVVSIVFPNVKTLSDLQSGNIAYKIRFPMRPPESVFDTQEDWSTQLTYPLMQDPGPRNRGDADGGYPYYCDKGFLSVQHNLAMAIGTVLNGGKPKEDVAISMKRNPYPAYYNDVLLPVIRYFLPLILMLSFKFHAFDLIKNLALEKEKRLKESMKIMGLSGWIHWASWFTKSLIFFTISTVLIVFLLCCDFGSSAVILKSDPSLILLFFMLYAITSMCFCCMMSTFFSKATSAATAGGIAWVLAYIPYFFLESRYGTMTFGQKLLSCLLFNTGMAFGAMQISLNEGAGFGVQWSRLATPATPDDSFAMSDVLVMFIVDSVIYSLITWYVDTAFPGEYGMPQKWYFPVLKRYWMKRSDSGIMDLPPTPQQVSAEFFENEPSDLKPGVQIQGLTKVFDRTKIAVNNLTLNMYENQITVLLGHNGAGKTTTMSMLTGLFPPTQGQAYVNGFEIHDDIRGVRSSLGLCPQFNVLFDDLTVEEHLYFACKLKCCPEDQMKSEIAEMLEATNLVDKRHNLSSTLSGGMKRRLSVGMAFVGGSKVVMLDEPTSGMDPAARRFTWELLQKQGKGRTILLTTHFMDEADILGDRIAIMADGLLQCCGTPMFLKKKFGAGYHMIIVKEPGCNVVSVKAFVKGIIPKAKLESNVGAELSFILPHNSSVHFPKLFSQIEEHKKELKISSYGASVTTMEEVFLRVGEQTDASVRKLLRGSEGGQPDGQYQQFNDDANSNGTPSPRVKLDSIDFSREPRETLIRNHGLRLIMEQFHAMFVKRMLHSRRNWMLMLAQLGIPIFFTAMILSAINAGKEVPTFPALKLDLEPFKFSTVTYASDTPTGRSLADTYASQFAGTTNKAVQASNQDVNLDDYLLQAAAKDAYNYNMHDIIGATFSEVRPGSGRLVAVAWFNNQPYHGPAISMAALDTALLRHYTGITNLNLQVINEPLPEALNSDNEAEQKDYATSFQVAFSVMFGMSFLVSSFIVFLVKERSCDAKHLQLVSGVYPATFWLSTFVWDFINFILPCLCVMLIFVCFQQEGYDTISIQGAMFLLFCAYGWCVLPFMYLWSFLFRVASSAYSRTVLFNIFSGMVSLIAVSILKAIPKLHDTAVLVDWLCMALPNYCLAYAFIALYNNYRGRKYCSGDYPSLAPMCSCEGVACLEHTDNYLSWKAPGIGRNILFLFLWGVVYSLLILVLEIGLGRRFMSFLYSWKLRTFQKAHEIQMNPLMGKGEDSEDDDVIQERIRIHQSDFHQLLSNNTLILRDLTKYYGLFKPFLAVDNLCVGVPSGECFGLLGINGAGKTSTFKMLTGDEIVSAGDAYVSGFSVRQQMRKVRHRLGYCAQFDALIDQMTGRETLVMYARLRGIHEQKIPTIVETLSTNLLFSEHIDKLVQTYSGGNKRKLSTAVAIIGDPPIVFLDEPTTGMDPMARRFVWDTISRLRDSGSSVILTSHSMEECDALCTRLAIMVNGRFQCLGSPQHLKNKFGKGYTLTAKVHHNEETEGQIDVITSNLQNFIMTTFPGSVLKDLHQGMVHYHIPNTSMSWANIFDALEKAKLAYHLEDYSIGQTTLEQVFLSFTRKQQGYKDVDS